MSYTELQKIALSYDGTPQSFANITGIAERLHPADKAALDAEVLTIRAAAARAAGQAAPSNLTEPLSVKAADFLRYGGHGFMQGFNKVRQGHAWIEKVLGVAGSASQSRAPTVPARPPSFPGARQPC